MPHRARARSAENDASGDAARLLLEVARPAVALTVARMDRERESAQVHWGCARQGISGAIRKRTYARERAAGPMCNVERPCYRCGR